MNKNLHIKEALRPVNLRAFNVIGYFSFIQKPVTFYLHKCCIIENKKFQKNRERGRVMENEVLVRFYRAYSREIYLYLYGLSNNRQLSEDLMQETFVKALLSLQTADTGVKAWLYKVARNLYFNTYRKDKRLVMGLDNAENKGALNEETEENPLNKLLINERDNVLYKALNKLEGKKKEVLLLQYFSGLSGKDIAKLLGITTENVRILAFRGKKELKLYLKEAGYEI